MGTIESKTERLGWMPKLFFWQGSMQGMQDPMGGGMTMDKMKHKKMGMM